MKPVEPGNVAPGGAGPSPTQRNTGGEEAATTYGGKAPQGGNNPAAVRSCSHGLCPEMCHTGVVQLGPQGSKNQTGQRPHSPEGPLRTLVRVSDALAKL